MKNLTKVNDIIEKIYRTIGTFLMMVLIAVVFSSVIIRNVFKNPMLWSVEVSIICFIWMIFLGAAIAVRGRRHYVVEVIPTKYKKANLIFDIIADIISYALIYVMIVNGVIFAKMGTARYTTSLGLPQTVMFVAIPLSGIAMALFNTEMLIKNINKYKKLVKGEVANESDSIVNG